MDVATKTLRKSTRDEGVRVLTAGVPILSINRENRRQVFVESRHDARFYEAIATLAAPYLIPEVSLSFIASGHEKDGGCSRVRELTRTLANAGTRSVFGIIDWDGQNMSTAHLRVLGENTRHSIENYLFDPLLLGALLFRERLISREALGLSADQTHVDMRNFDDTQLQVVVDYVLDKIAFPLNGESQSVEATYCNGRTIKLPIDFMHFRGHDLEDRIREKFPPLAGAFRVGPSVKWEMLGKVLDELPGFLPQDLVGLLRGIQHG